MNAFLFLLNGIVNTGGVGPPRPEVPQFGNQTVNSTCLFGQSNGKVAVKNTNDAKDQGEPQRMVSHVVPEPVRFIAEAPLFVAAPQLWTKQDASVVGEDRLAPGFGPEFSATPPCPM